MFHVPNILPNRNLYLDNNVCNTSRSSSVNCFYLMLPYVSHISFSERPIYAVYAVCRLVHVLSHTALHVKKSCNESVHMTSWLYLLSSGLYILCARLHFPEFVSPENINIYFNSDNMSNSITISYLWFLHDSSTWKFHVMLFVASSLGSTITNLLWCFVWNSPPWVLQLTGVVYLFCSFLFVWPVL